MKKGVNQHSLIVLYPKDLWHIPGYGDKHITTLYREYNRIRDFSAKKRPQRITTFDLALFLDVDVREILPFLRHITA